jgi:hypothetical protein
MGQHDVGTKEDLVIYRLESAKEDLRAAKTMRDVPSYKAANNRHIMQYFT